MILSIGGIFLNNRQSRVNAILSLAIASVLWSTAGLLIKWVPWNPIAIAGMRSGIAGIVLISFWLIRYKSLPTLPTKKKFFASINYVILVMLFIASNKLTTAANAILLQFTAPVWVMFFAAIFLKEPIKKSDVLTVIVVLSGMVLFFIGNLGAGGMLGNFLAILSGVAMAIMVVSLKGVQTGSPLEIILWGNILTFIVGIPFYNGLNISSASVGGILLLGIFQLGISYIFYANGIQKVTALEGILIPVLEPLLNPVWVFIFAGEKPTIYALLGGVIVVGAVVVKSLYEMKVNNHLKQDLI